MFGFQLSVLGFRFSVSVFSFRFSVSGLWFPVSILGFRFHFSGFRRTHARLRSRGQARESGGRVRSRRVMITTFAEMVGLLGKAFGVRGSGSGRTIRSRVLARGHGRAQPACAKHV